mmetsp:Transcript_26083/g.47314  ORF Transcript_26083/g.47314 Transcript_26083/m.47314 type:complete len:174 (+) Transcript_26083:320-841(+)
MSNSTVASTRPSGISRRCSLDPGCLRQSSTAAAVPVVMQQQHRRCSFSTISVREYDQTVGDNPSCQEGAPIALGWNYAERKSICVDEFEKARKTQRKTKRSDLLLGVVERRNMLVRNGTTIMEILHAERLVAMKNGMASMGRSMGYNMKSSATSSDRNGGIQSPRKAMVSRAA